MEPVKTGILIAEMVEPIRECPCIQCNESWHAGRGCSCGDCCDKLREWTQSKTARQPCF